MGVFSVLKLHHLDNSQVLSDARWQINHLKHLSGTLHSHKCLIIIQPSSESPEIELMALSWSWLGIQVPIVNDKLIKMIKLSELITSHKFKFAIILITSLAGQLLQLTMMLHGQRGKVLCPALLSTSKTCIRIFSEIKIRMKCHVVML